MIVEPAVFTCSICGEPSTDICALCTKDACQNHRCNRCKRCSDCCECEVPLGAESKPETVEEVAVASAAADPAPLLSAVQPDPPEDETPLEQPPDSGPQF